MSQLQPPVLIRITTIPLSLNLLLTGQPAYFRSKGYTVLTASGPGHDVPADYHTTLPLSRELSPWQDLKALWVTWRWLRKLQPNIVHTHTPKAGLIGMLAAWLAGVPIRLHTVAGLPEMEATGWLKRVLRLTEKITAYMATRVYPNSDGLLQYMVVHHLAPASKMKVIGHGSSNGIDTEWFSATEELKQQAASLRKLHEIPEEDVVFVFVGRLDNHKGLRELQETFDRLYAKSAPIWLLLVGPVEEARGGLDEKVRNWMQQHPHVVAVGFQSDVRPWLLSGDVLVFPSYREGFPNVPLQAAALGLPAIVTDINGCNEIVAQGENGLLIPPKDANALQQAMAWMLLHPLERQTMGKAARHRIEQRYARQAVWQALQEEYERLLTRR